MDFGKIIERIKAILATPKTEWPVIAAEPSTPAGLYSGYIAIVAALPAIAGFLKSSLIGTSLFGITVRSSIGMGLAQMVLRYLLSLVLLYVVALVVNALAPSFGARKDMNQALKLVAYAWTASWVAGIGVIVPWLGWLIALAGGVYAIYLLYLGLPATMQCPPEKAGGYTAVSVIIAIVLGWITAIIVAGVFGAAMFGASAAGGMNGLRLSNSDGSNVSVDGNSTLGKLAAMGQRMEQANKELEAAQKSGDSKAQTDAMGKVMGAMAGSNGAVEALAPDQIKTFLPDSVDGLKRSSLSAQRNAAMGMQVSTATAEYANADQSQHLTLEVSDSGGAKGLVALATSMAPEEEKQTDHGYEKTWSADGNLMHEAWDSQSKYGEYSIMVGQRFSVKASGNVDGIDQLKQAVASVDLAKLAALKNVGVK